MWAKNNHYVELSGLDRNWQGVYYPNNAKRSRPGKLGALIADYKKDLFNEEVVLLSLALG
jgi:hypothetical protein